MAEKKIKLGVEDVCDVKTVVAEPPNIKLKNNNPKIIFDNETGVDAQVRFFEFDDKDGTLIEGFCPGVELSGPLKGVLIVGKGKKVDCKPNESGSFSYSVEAGSYAPLDPIIIIEDSLDFPGAILFSLLPAAIVLPVVAAAGAVIGVFGCRAMMRRKNG